MNIRVKLIEDWHIAWRWWSMQISAIGVVLMGASEILGQAWTSVPPDLRRYLPYADTIALVLFLLAMIARVIDQGAPRAKQ